MGCGCGRRRANRGDRLKKQRAKILKAQKLSAKPDRVVSNSAMTAKSSICMSCPESKQSPAERKKGIRVCHKTNRLINNILRDPRFVCPLGKWRNSK